MCPLYTVLNGSWLPLLHAENVMSSANRVFHVKQHTDLYTKSSFTEHLQEAYGLRKGLSEKVGGWNMNKYSASATGSGKALWNIISRNKYPLFVKYLRVAKIIVPNDLFSRG